MSLVFKLIRACIPQSMVNRLKTRYNVPDMEWSLTNLYLNGFKPKQIIDIGAYEGEWTIMTAAIFPEAKILMLEAQDSKQDKLALLKSNNIDFHIGLLGPESNLNSKFYINETVSSALPETEKSGQEFVEVPMFSLDEILELKKATQPDFIKLDVQGFELEVLKGAKKALASAEVVLMEVSLLEINKGAPLILEVMNFMNLNSFVCYDICSIVRRPLDKALWQTDLIFVKKSSKLVASKKYQN